MVLSILKKSVYTLFIDQANRAIFIAFFFCINTRWQCYWQKIDQIKGRSWDKKKHIKRKLCLKKKYSFVVWTGFYMLCTVQHVTYLSITRTRLITVGSWLLISHGWTRVIATTPRIWLCRMLAIESVVLDFFISILHVTEGYNVVVVAGVCVFLLFICCAIWERPIRMFSRSANWPQAYWTTIGRFPVNMLQTRPLSHQSLNILIFLLPLLPFN